MYLLQVSFPHLTLKNHYFALKFAMIFRLGDPVSWQLSARLLDRIFLCLLIHLDQLFPEILARQQP